MCFGDVCWRRTGNSAQISTQLTESCSLQSNKEVEQNSTHVYLVVRLVVVGECAPLANRHNIRNLGPCHLNDFVISEYVLIAFEISNPRYDTLILTTISITMGVLSYSYCDKGLSPRPAFGPISIVPSTCRRRNTYLASGSLAGLKLRATTAAKVAASVTSDTPGPQVFQTLLPASSKTCVK